METSDIQTQIPIIYGGQVEEHLPEHREMLKYESGSADQDAGQVSGPNSEPWLNVLAACEPASPPALEHSLTNAATRLAVRGKVIDLGAGTCWATARISQVAEVEEVVALDMSERFLTTVGNRIITRLNGNRKKIRFAVSSFNEVPLDSEYFDCAFLIAAIHHSVTPLRTLAEVLRVLKPDGSLLVVEAPSSVIGIRKARSLKYELTVASSATELAYTREELEYMLRHAGFKEIKFYAVDDLTRNPVKLAIRKMLRALGLEHIFLTVTYIIHARKSAGAQ
jgi:ubiquinone/menaquinone biosynthesis C-methylase UbiE